MTMIIIGMAVDIFAALQGQAVVAERGMQPRMDHSLSGSSGAMAIGV